MINDQTGQNLTWRSTLGSLTALIQLWKSKADGPLPWVLKHEGRLNGDWTLLFMSPSRPFLIDGVNGKPALVALVGKAVNFFYKYQGLVAEVSVVT